ncbi:hypothetical protein FGIG_04766 [Fasciola gigantica]|uniref:C2H2-type domain-containing protein n=1 Tax=Fasciola gigantica TaxID=46835 RepID=A0A504YSU4_FASGI|nr:hypothetical protein FGIG_04766 [Fasciola gigantica]
MKNTDDSFLLNQLKEVFCQNFRHCQRLDVVGILSYTIDNNSERFLKLDFSTVKGSGVREFITEHELDVNQTGNPDSNARSCIRGADILRDPNDFKDSSSPANASPPLLPPLVIQNSRISRCSNICSAVVLDSLCSSDNAESPKDVVDGPLYRRDRRKSRRPKRQIIDSEKRGVDSETEDGTEQDEAISSSDHETYKPGKIPRLAYPTDVTACNPVLNVPTQNKFTGARIIQEGSAVTPGITQQLMGQTIIPSSESSSSTSQILVSKHNEVYCRGPEIQPQSAAAAKYTIATKTLGLGELGEFCGLLPLNNILGRTILSCHDGNSLTLKVAPTNNGTSNPLVIPISDANSHLNTHHAMIPVTTNTGSTQNVLLNPNIAAAVAAALSTPAQAPVSAVTYSDQQNVTGIQSFNGPSIALTGPSGELIGTIPIGPGGQQHGILQSVLGTALNSQSSNAVTTVNTVSVSVPLSSCTNGGSNLATTLNWLRCASASNELTHSSAQPILPPITTNNQITTSTSVALLQSLAGQNTIHQLGSAPGKVSSFSVGPTLALIGTLGLNPMPSSSSSVSTNNENQPATSSGTTNATLLTTNLGISASNNNAALVAAALLRGLAGAKNISAEVVEPTCLETSIGGVPGSVTLIPGSHISSGSSASGRSNIMATESTFASLSNMLSAKVINSTSGTPTSATFSMYDAPACAGTNMNRIGQNNNTMNNINTAVTRGSIMFSYPRGQGEMNVVFTPASAQSLHTGSLSSGTSVPTAIPFQNMLSPHTTSVTLASPVLLHTQLGSSGGSKSTTVCTTSTVSSTLSVSPTVLPPIRSKHNPLENKPLQDPTASAIDRILQTIKGCMNTESKQKFTSASAKKNEPVENPPSALKHSVDDTNKESNSGGESKQPYSLKVIPASVSVVKNPSSGTQMEEPPKIGDGNINSATSGDRAPLVPIAKDPNDHENPPTYRVTKVYRCRYCGKTFNRKFCRERHERLHTGVKPYTCEICEEKFIRLEDKKRHVRSLQHYLSGRGSFLKVESVDGTGEDAATLDIDSSAVLPLLTQTLQGCDPEGVNGNLADLEEAAGLSASEDTSNDHVSECESSDAEEIPDKVVIEFHPSTQSSIRLNTPDDSSEAPELRHTPVSCGEEENTYGITENEVRGKFVDSQSCLVLSTEGSVFKGDESRISPGSNVQNAMGVTSVVLINGEELQSSISST